MTKDEATVHLTAAILSNANCAGWTPEQIVQRADEVLSLMIKTELSKDTRVDHDAARDDGALKDKPPA